VPAVVAVFRGEQTGFHGRGHGDDLEDRAQRVGALSGAVEQRHIFRIENIAQQPAAVVVLRVKQVGVKRGRRDQGQNAPGVHFHDHNGALEARNGLLRLDLQVFVQRGVDVLRGHGFHLCQAADARPGGIHHVEGGGALARQLIFGPVFQAGHAHALIAQVALALILFQLLHRDKLHIAGDVRANAQVFVIARGVFVHHQPAEAREDVVAVAHVGG